MRSMYRQLFVFTLMFSGAMFVSAAVKPGAKISSVTVTNGSNGIEVEIAASEAVAMRSQVTTGPDRLVLDFPNALPGSDLHNQTINRGGVNGIRVGLFSQNPPVRELPEAIRHDLDGERLTLYAEFVNEDIDVRTVEERVASSAAGAPLHLPGASEQRTPLKVER